MIPLVRTEICEQYVLPGLVRTTSTHCSGVDHLSSIKRLQSGVRYTEELSVVPYTLHYQLTILASLS